jgi:hypothetical protein
MLSENLMTGKVNNADQFARYRLIGESEGRSASIRSVTLTVPARSTPVTLQSSPITGCGGSRGKGAGQ